MSQCETQCIICGESIPIPDYEHHSVYVKVCGECKEAVDFIKFLMKKYDNAGENNNDQRSRSK